jgi:restriction endonuclease Mrr
MSRPANHPLFPIGDRVEEALLLTLSHLGSDTAALFAADTYEPLGDFFDLSGYARSVTRAEYLHDGHNEPYWHTWVQWARDRLVKSGDLECPRRGIWMLTEQGKRRAERLRARMRQVELPVLNGHTVRLVDPVMLKAPSELTLEDLGL